MGSSLSVLNKNVLLKAAVSDVAIQWACFVVAQVFKTEKFYDLVGSSSFLYLTWATLIWSKRGHSVVWHPRQTIQNSCISVWAVRLGTYLFSRVIASGGDRRFRKAKENPLLFFTFWTMQAVWVWLTLLPTMILNTKEVNKELNYRDYLGWSVWALGFLIEVIADYEKSKFKSRPENSGKFISVGLWSLCRHPNYLGEVMMWAGLFLPATNVMQGKEFISIISPFFVSYLLTKVSGIPMLERYAEKKWSGNADYQKYKASTAMTIPFVW